MGTIAMRRLAGGLVGSGGVLFALGNALHPLEHNEAAHAAPAWEAAHLIFALGGLLVAAGLPLLLAVGGTLRPSRFGVTGGVLLAVAFAALGPGAWFEAFVAPLPGGVAEQVEGGPGGAVNAAAGTAWIAAMVIFGLGLAWRGTRRSVRLSGAGLLAAAAVLLLGPGLPVAEGLYIIPATIVAGLGLLTVGVAAARTASGLIPAHAPASQPVVNG